MDVVVPDLGDFSDVEVIEVFVKPGDSVAAEDPLITLETDKAAMDVPSPAAGTIEALKIAVGDRVSAGDVIAELDEGGGAKSEGGSDSETDDESAAESRGEAAGASSGSAAGAGASADREAAQADAEQRDEAASEAGDAEPEPVTVPDLGDFSDVEVIDVLVAEGDTVEAEQGLVTLETEKATMDVPTPIAGRVVALEVEIGSRVNTGSEIARIAPTAPASEPAQAERERAPEPAQSAETEAEPHAAAQDADARSVSGGAAPGPAKSSRTSAVASLPAVDERSFSTAHASPSVRKLARELGVDLGRVAGSGRKGRVTADDVKAYVKEILEAGAAAGIAWPEVPEVDFAKYGEVEIKPLSRIQRISGPRLHASWVNLPHVTQHDEADITDLESTRQELKAGAAERGIKLTPLAFILRAVVLTLAEYDRLKSSLTPDGQNLVLKKYMHIGFAADTPNGLVVPVIRDADRKDVYELATRLGELSDQARQGKLKPDDMQGGVFTVSSLGGIGGTFFTPIIVAPEVAILGVSRSRWQPVWNGAEFVPRLMLPLSLSYDHRVVDGAEAVRFTTRLAETLGDVERILEATP